MIKITSLSVAGTLLAFGLSAAPAHAPANRTWVSGKGTDAGACTVIAPCRTFAFALTRTSAGGEIDVLDPAGYGTVTIAKAISIVNDAVGVAAIGAYSGNAITINAGASDSVHLRGLTIDGFGSGSSGILFNTGGNLASKIASSGISQVSGSISRPARRATSWSRIRLLPISAVRGSLSRPPDRRSSKARSAKPAMKLQALMSNQMDKKCIGQNVSRRIKKAKRRSAMMARTAFPSIMSGHARITAASLNGNETKPKPPS